MPRSIVARSISDVPRKLRSKLAANLPHAAKAYDEAIADVLGVPGSARRRSAPGEAPREQTGHLKKHTTAVPDPSDLSVTIVTTDYGKRLNDRADRPWVARVVRLAHAEFRRRLFAR